jgi:hypothetical protein
MITFMSRRNFSIFGGLGFLGLTIYHSFSPGRQRLKRALVGLRASMFWKLPNSKVFRPLLWITAFEVVQHNEIAVTDGLPTDLLYETRHSLLAALADNGTRPLEIKRACPMSAFSPDNDPMNAIKVEIAYVFQQRLNGQEPN